MIFKNGGFSPQQSAIGFHLLLQYVMASSYAEVSRQLPGFHQVYIHDKIYSYSESELCGARYFADAFSTLDSETSIPEGLRLLIDSFETWQK